MDSARDKNHDVIWLAPVCEGIERAWAQDNVWTECECGGNHKPVKYERAAWRNRKQLERIKRRVRA